MTKALRLDSPNALPHELADRLASHRNLFHKHEFLERILENESVRAVADDLDEYLKEQRIHGYHCTKEPSPDYFKRHGLRPTDIRSHQAEFLNAFGDRFTATEITDMKTAWERYFERSQQRSVRDGLVWACLSQELVTTGGTYVFFRYYGGEAIFMPLKEHPSIAPKLEAIGRSVIVEVALPGDLLIAQHAMSYAVLSRFHATIRRDAYPYYSEARIRRPIPPEDIIAVTPLNDFNR